MVINRQLYAMWGGAVALSSGIELGAALFLISAASFLVPYYIGTAHETSKTGQIEDGYHNNPFEQDARRASGEDR